MTSPLGDSASSRVGRSSFSGAAGLVALAVLAPVSAGMAQDGASPDPGTVHLHPERF